MSHSDSLNALEQLVWHLSPLFIRLHELIESGDFCGALDVDRAFENHVKLFRKYMNNLPVNVEKQFMEREWEHGVKRNFDGSNGPWIVDLPQKPQKPVAALRSLFQKQKSSTLALEG